MALAYAHEPGPGSIPSAYWDNFESPPGYRAEIVRGELVLSPSPSRAHQRAVMALAQVLIAACPSDCEVLPDIEWRLDHHGVVAQAPRPDLVVVTRTEGPIIEPPVLAVEVLSRTDSRRLERHPMSRIQGKYADYAQNGLRYCLEIATDQPAALMNVCIDGSWETVAWAEGDDLLAVELPFPFSFRPADLT
jgi:hypothetical protein